MLNKILISLSLSVFYVIANAQENIGYQRPPAVIEKLILATFNPTVSFNEKGDWMLIMQRSVAPTIEDLAQPELRVAGLRINPTNFSPSRSTNYSGLSLKNVGTGKEYSIKGLPVKLKVLASSWNTAGNRIAFAQENRASIDLYVIDLSTYAAKKINKTPLNIAQGINFEWVDHETIFYQGTTVHPSAIPVRPVAPAGPVVQQNLGKVAASRTYQDLIKNKYDEDLFRFFVKSQLIFNKNGMEKKVGKPDYFSSIYVSPDKKYLLVERLQGTLSYLVPANGFASIVEVWDMNGRLVRKIADIPSSELSPSGFDNVLNAPRRFDWVDTKPNTVGWIIPLDSGLIKKDVKDHDAYVTMAAPFSESPVTVVKTPMRLYNVSYVNNDVALVTQGSFAKQRRVWQLLDLKTGGLSTLNDRSINDAYNDLGTPFTVKNQYGRNVPLVIENSKLVMRGQGASPKGDYPFVGTFDFKTKQLERLWQSKDPYFEQPLKLLSYKDGVKFVTSRQSNQNTPNYFIVTSYDSLSNNLTTFSDPQPDLRQLKMEKIKYKRKDGVDLTANLYVSKNYNPAKNGKLPVVIVAYPREFKSASDAAQVRGSQNTFTITSYSSFVPFALLGYAVMDATEFPIVGEGDKYPNDDFVEQLEWNAKAAIDKIVSMGIGDSTRVGVAGHSYGAFMTANLLAHTNLFKAGIARSGAYNRTLTPFGFQNEERTYWQAPEVYFRMSPFSYADKIKTPLLLIHGEADNNPGTFPIQSERLFNAVKGHGGTVRFVQLPFESHGYAAKENLLHLLWEEYEWLEKYVKGEK